MIITALMDLYDASGPVIWSYARKRTDSETEACGVIVAAFGDAAQQPLFFDGRVSSLARLLLLVHAATQPAHPMPTHAAGGRHWAPTCQLPLAT
jgi:hypothetical protein